MCAHRHVHAHTHRTLIMHLISGVPDALVLTDRDPCVKEHLSFHDDGHEEKWDLKRASFTFWGLI